MRGACKGAARIAIGNAELRQHVRLCFATHPRRVWRERGACEGAARNPGAAGRIQTMMILGLALIESLVLFALLIVFTVVRGA